MSRRHTGPGRYAWMIALGAPIAFALYLLIRGMVPPEAAQPARIDFAVPGLVDHEGRPIDAGYFAGRHALVYFGFTHCPDACPTSLFKVKQAFEQLEGAGENVVPVLVSVDPERDTPVVLAGYVAYFHPRLIGITGNTAAITELAGRFGIQAEKVRVEGSATDYLIDHSSGFVLVAPDGRIVARRSGSAETDEIVAMVREAS